MDFYRKHILQRSEPDLTDVIQTLAQLGRKERNLPLEALPTDEELAKLRGNINRNEPIHIQTMRGETYFPLPRCACNGGARNVRRRGS